MLKNMKLGVKMLGSFLIVAGIVVIVGFIGLTGAQQLSSNVEEIGQVRLPSIESLLKTELYLEEIMVAQRTLLSEMLNSQERSAYLQEFNNAREEYAKAWAHFLTLPATAEEERLSSLFDTEIAEWREINDQWLELNKQFETLNILDPADLVAKMQQFRGDHYAVELDVSTMLLTGREFEGGEDPTACNFGRWLSGFTTENPELQRMLNDVQNPHDRFHRTAGEIRDLVQAGNVAEGQALFQNTMIPAADEVFDYLYRIIALAEETSALRSEINNLVLGTISDEAYEAMDVLDDIIHINENIAAEEVTAAMGAAQNAILVVIIGMIVGTILAVILGLVLTQAITRPVAKGVAFAQEIAMGDLESKLEVVQKDEIGVLADALREMQKALQYKADVVEQIANKDLTVQFKKVSEKDGLGESLVVMKDSLNELLGQVDNAVDQVSSGADQVSQASQSLSQGATEQASSLEEISSSSNEVNGQANQNADNATEATALAKKASEDAESGNLQMKDLVEAMNKINASSDEINKVVKVIDDIAFQINLLALNANVEAARAGKYGKGFAVVAEEVRNLAVRAADAVKETSEMVEESITNIKQGNGLVEKTAEQLVNINEGAGKVADFLSEIALASKEQAQAIEQITNGLDQIDQVTQANTASAEESASASEELAGQAQQLKAMVAQFNLEKRAGLITDNRQKGQLTQGAGGQKSVGQKPQKGGAQVQKGTGRTGTVLGTGSAKKTTKTTQRTSGGTQTAGNTSQKSKIQGKEETGIKPMDPEDVIKLDDDDFDNF